MIVGVAYRPVHSESGLPYPPNKACARVRVSAGEMEKQLSVSDKLRQHSVQYQSTVLQSGEFEELLTAVFGSDGSGAYRGLVVGQGRMRQFKSTIIAHVV